MFAPSTPFVGFKTYPQYMPSTSSSSKCLQDIVQYEARREELSALFPHDRVCTITGGNDENLYSAKRKVNAVVG